LPKESGGAPAESEVAIDEQHVESARPSDRIVDEAPNSETKTDPANPLTESIKS
jgi:hypothetical protein